MSSSAKTIGGITLIGVLAFLFEAGKFGLDIYQFNQPDTRQGTEQSLKNMQQLQLDVDSIRKSVKDTILRDSLIKKRAMQELDRIRSSIK